MRCQTLIKGGDYIEEANEYLTQVALSEDFEGVTKVLYYILGRLQEIERNDVND